MTNNKSVPPSHPIPSHPSHAPKPKTLQKPHPTIAKTNPPQKPSVLEIVQASPNSQSRQFPNPQFALPRPQADGETDTTLRQRYDGVHESVPRYRAGRDRSKVHDDKDSRKGGQPEMIQKGGVSRANNGRTRKGLVPPADNAHGHAQDNIVHPSTPCQLQGILQKWCHTRKSFRMLILATMLPPKGLEIPSSGAGLDALCANIAKSSNRAKSTPIVLL